MNETVFTNARLITPDAVVEGSLLVRDGNIASLDEGASAAAERIDLEGDYLLPGLVELHTDNLEKHFIPRPKVVWPQGVPAFFAHDAQIVASGITTVFDALSVGEYHDKGRIAMLGKAVNALNACRDSGQLRAEHLLHLRCEVADPRMQELFFPLSDTPALRLVSLMDHTPGQRQWRDTSSYRTYYSNLTTWTDEEFEKIVARLQETRDDCAEDNAASVMAFCRERGLPMASHDDTLVEHVEEALDNGIAISEFPTTIEAARHAAENGMLVLMGAPNVVRGGSHSGNVSALEVAQAGYLGSLSSDYVPISLLEAAFALSEAGYMPLHAAVGLVTANPAEAVGLDDRGSLETTSCASAWSRASPWCATCGGTAWRSSDAAGTARLRHGGFRFGQGQPLAGPAPPAAGMPGGVRPSLHHPARRLAGGTAYRRFSRTLRGHARRRALCHGLAEPRPLLRHRQGHRGDAGTRARSTHERLARIPVRSAAALSRAHAGSGGGGPRRAPLAPARAGSGERRGHRGTHRPRVLVRRLPGKPVPRGQLRAAGSVGRMFLRTDPEVDVAPPTRERHPPQGFSAAPCEKHRIQWHGQRRGRRHPRQQTINQ